MRIQEMLETAQRQAAELLLEKARHDARAASFLADKAQHEAELAKLMLDETRKVASTMGLPQLRSRGGDS